MELNLIWVVLLAVVSIVILISLTTNIFQPVAYWLYCDIFLKISSFFSEVNSASMPSYCKQNVVNGGEVVKINSQDNEMFSRDLLSYIISCWKRAEIEESYSTHTCYELRLQKSVDNVTEANVTRVLANEDLCRSIENSDYGCGARNQIIWDIGGGVITNQKIILIEYNETNVIRVIG